MPLLRLKPAITAIAVLLLGLPLTLYGWFLSQRPARVAQEKPLFQGIVYRREVFTQPRPNLVHIVRIDLTQAGLRPLVTPGTPTPGLQEIKARTTSEFLTEFGVQLAINANFFYPFREDAPWDYAPQAGEPTNVLGVAISDGKQYSPPEADWVALCFLANRRAAISARGTCPPGTQQAVAGNTLLISQGKAVGAADPSQNDFYGRTAVGLDARGSTLWLVAIDDKQPFYSEGMTLAELGSIFLALGADSAINLDGGGSTTLAMAGPSGPILLNAPIHTKLPLRERPIANHLGFYARPAAPQ